MRLAAIDIGTNTLLLIIADIEEGKVKNIVADKHRIARLGEGVDKNGKISDAALNRAVKILEEYRQLIKENNVDDYHIIGTSALRDAENKAEVLLEINKAAGKEIEIISGEREAELSYLGSIEARDSENIVLDIGGGSTEIITGKGDEIVSINSLQIGAVRTTERFFNTQEEKVENYQKAQEYIQNEFEKLNGLKFSGNLIAVAGTPTTIAAIDMELPQYNAHLIHNHVISLNRLNEIVNILRNHSSAELVSKYNVHPNRADVILGGAVILAEFVKFTGKSSFIVSCKGLRYGIILDLFKTKTTKN